MTVALNDHFKRVMVFYNPASTHASQSKLRITQLQQFFGKERVTVVETVPGGPIPNRALLHSYAPQLGGQTLLCIAGGDGTISTMLEALVKDPELPNAARRTPVLPLWGGNSNDLAHMLNGNASHKRLHEILTRGKTIAVHPLECTLETAGGEQSTRIAACYVSFGATALAAARLNAPDVRRHPFYRFPPLRLWAQFAASLKALVRAPAFVLEEQGTKKLVYERTFTNGSRFANIERLPLKLTENAFLQHTLEEKRLAKVLPRMWEAMQKSLVERFKQNHTEFTIQQDILAQFDGEPAEIAAGTRVCMTLSERPFYALSLMLTDTEKPKTSG